MNAIVFLLVFVVVTVLVLYLVQLLVTSLKLTDPIRSLIYVLAVLLLPIWLLQHFGVVPLG